MGYIWSEREQKILKSKNWFWGVINNTDGLNKVFENEQDGAFLVYERIGQPRPFPGLLFAFKFYGRIEKCRLVVYGSTNRDGALSERVYPPNDAHRRGVLNRVKYMVSEMIITIHNVRPSPGQVRPIARYPGWRSVVERATQESQQRSQTQRQLPVAIE